MKLGGDEEGRRRLGVVKARLRFWTDMQTKQRGKSYRSIY